MNLRSVCFCSIIPGLSRMKMTRVVLRVVIFVQWKAETLICLISSRHDVKKSLHFELRRVIKKFPCMSMAVQRCEFHFISLTLFVACKHTSLSKLYTISISCRHIPSTPRPSYHFKNGKSVVQPPSYQLCRKLRSTNNTQEYRSSGCVSYTNTIIAVCVLNFISSRCRSYCNIRTKTAAKTPTILGQLSLSLLPEGICL